MDVGPLIIGFSINLIVTFVIVRFIYFPPQREKKFVLTFLGFNVSIFFVLALMSRADLEVTLGAAFGLFAIFSILRYRSSAMPIRETTYLFVSIAIAVMNSTLVSTETVAGVAIANLVTILVMYALEKGWGFRYQSSKTVTYDKIKLIKPARQEDLLADLEKRFGFAINCFDIGQVNLSRGTADITIYYDKPLQPPQLIYKKREELIDEAQ